MELTRCSVEDYKAMRKLPLRILSDNVRSMHNIGSFFRMSDAFRVEEIILAGISGTPPHPEIAKTALGAEESVAWRHVDDASAVSGNAYVDAVREAIKNEGSQLLVVAAKTESEIAELETYEERREFLEEMGLEESGVNRLIRAAYALLDLQTYFTAGADEVRAWTFRRGTKAPQAAGIIHTDFEKGFIRAEVIKYEDYVTLGSEAAVKEAGKMGVEGKEYIVQDGDVMHFRFNV